MKVYFVPPALPCNAYITNMVAGLEKNGVEIVNKRATNRYAELLYSFPAMFKRTRVYHFNWIENRSAANTFKNRIFCRLILYWLRLIKMTGGKIAWTMHNRESHSFQGDKAFHHAFLRKFISITDMIFIHAKESKDILVERYQYPEEKICYIPLPSYNSDAHRELPAIHEHGNFVILAFGLIRKYKNIPLLIRAFKELGLPNSALEIYGICDGPELLRSIEEGIGGCSNIKFKNEFVPEEEVPGIFAGCDVVVLPYDKQSMINSAVAVYAFSEAKPIVVCRFGAIKDIEDRSFVHCYDYSNDEEALRGLKEQLTLVYNEWKQDRQALRREGEEAFKYAQSDELSRDNITAKVVKFYAEH